MGTPNKLLIQYAMEAGLDELAERLEWYNARDTPEPETTIIKAMGMQAEAFTAGWLAAEAAAGMPIGLEAGDRVRAEAEYLTDHVHATHLPLSQPSTSPESDGATEALLEGED